MTIVLVCLLVAVVSFPAMFGFMLATNIALSKIVKEVRNKDENLFKELISGKPYTYLEDWFQGSYPSAWQDRKNFNLFMETERAFDILSESRIKMYKTFKILFTLFASLSLLSFVVAWIAFIVIGMKL